MILLILISLSVGWMAYDISKAPYMDDYGNYTDKDGNII